MNQKHFNFDLYYFPLQASNIFQSIKIEQKNKNNNKNKNGGYGVKRFSFKNELNFEQIPQLFNFERSHRKKRQKHPRIIKTPKSNQTIDSINEQSPSRIWSPQIKLTNEKNLKKQNQRGGESCPKMSFILKNKQNIPPSSRHIKINNNSIVKQNTLCRIQSKIHIFDKNIKQKVQQLDQLQQCESQISNDSSTITIPDMKKIINNVRSQQNVLEVKNKKNNQNDKNIKKRKTQKSLSPRKSNNPQNNQGRKSINNKQSQISSLSVQRDDKNSKLWNSLFAEQNNKKTQKKFISLCKKSYYVIPSKNKKNRSLNKQNKKKIKSYNKQNNVILSNGASPKYSSIPSNNYRNTSLASTVIQKNKKSSIQKQIINEKINKINIKNLIINNHQRQLKQKSINNHNNKNNQNNKLNQNEKTTNNNNQNNHNNHNDKCNNNHQSSPKILKNQLFDIMRKTGQVLNKYKGQCTQLRKEKEQYEMKYKQAIKKLNRIKQQLEVQLMIQ